MTAPVNSEEHLAAREKVREKLSDIKRKKKLENPHPFLFILLSDSHLEKIHRNLRPRKDSSVLVRSHLVLLLHQSAGERR